MCADVICFRLKLYSNCRRVFSLIEMDHISVSILELNFNGKWDLYAMTTLINSNPIWRSTLINLMRCVCLCLWNLCQTKTWKNGIRNTRMIDRWRCAFFSENFVTGMNMDVETDKSLMSIKCYVEKTISDVLQWNKWKKARISIHNMFHHTLFDDHIENTSLNR